MPLPHDVMPRPGPLRSSKPDLSLAERNVLALERIAAADEERNRLLNREALERREAWAESHATSSRLLALAEGTEQVQHVSDQFLGRGEPRPSRSGVIRRVSSDNLGGRVRRSLEIEFAFAAGDTAVTVAVGDQVEVTFLR